MILLSLFLVLVLADEQCTAARRGVRKLGEPHRTFEGEGFPVARAFPTSYVSSSDVDPFLMLDHMGPVNNKPGEGKGAPWHPHRGFETVTYMVQGEFQHADSLGNSGILRPGDVQWMTAGSGIIHHEVPSAAFQKVGGIMEGFQLWINLPAKHKMADPRYQDVPKENIPEIRQDNFLIRVIAGSPSESTTSPAIHTYTPITYLDVHGKKNAKITLQIPQHHNGFIFVYKGSIRIFSGIFCSSSSSSPTSTIVKQGQVAVLDKQGSTIEIEIVSTECDGSFSDCGGICEFGEDCTKFLVVHGEPIAEPIVQRGPFVMNTQEEINQAISDYKNNKFTRVNPKFASKTPDNV